MDNTIEAAGWRGRLNAGLAPRQLEALIYACADMTSKEIARLMGISPKTVQQRLDDARFKLGRQRTVRGLCLEAMKRGIVAPLAVIILLNCCAMQQMPSVRRPPTAPRVAHARINRRGEYEFCG
ncbi:sigma factor-like helix-turn-helix DNA-binding protein [Pseudomonas sp. EA_35y_Pfl2_R111]|uniref:sigma factor-like helix-turn-helix DNA-binding protein n=1 Tax=Pseudomonas sp. EA_35y_Pfl2_R111 TaxID=3088689 RepID=UPI0030DDB48C